MSAAPSQPLPPESVRPLQTQEVEALAEVSVERIAEGIEGVLKVSGRISESRFVQYIRLAADSRRIELETEIDWKELHRLLKVSFPVAVYAENALNEMQVGYVERPTHRSIMVSRITLSFAIATALKYFLLPAVTGGFTFSS